MGPVGVTIAALLLVTGCVDAARILAVLPMAARSHHIAITTLTKELARRGHDVTLLSSLPHKDIPNHKTVMLPKIMEIDLFNPNKTSPVNFFEEPMSVWGGQFFLWWLGELIVENTFSSPEFQAVVDAPGQKFDLIIAEIFFYQEAMMGLGHKFNAPVIAVNPFGTYFWLNEVMGNPNNPSWVPSAFLGSTDHMDFGERFLNTVYAMFQKLGHELFYIRQQQALLDKYFPDAPPLRQLFRQKLALALVNNHHSLFYPAPMSPNVVEVGGMHISHEAKPLPKALKDFLDGAKDGFVYFSMGSNIKLRMLAKEKKQALLSSLGALKERVLMKWDGPTPDKLPANIRLEEWLPQSDVLRHKNIRLFITHGGLLSTQEAVFHGVPLIGMPVFGDQYFNLRLARAKGFAVQLNHQELSQERLNGALKEILGNPKYTVNVKRLSALFKAQPMKAIDTAVFWVDHVLAHGGDHLQPASLDLCWTQLLLLDILAAVAVPIIAFLLCCRALCCRKKSTTKKDMKQKTN